MSQESLRHIYEVTILESHIDYFGHVNHANYLVLFEQARWDMITQRGYGLARVKSTGAAPIVLDIHVRFRKEIALREKIKIETKVLSYEKKISTLYQEIRNEANKVCCTAELKCGLFDLARRKLLPPSPEWLVALGFGPERFILKSSNVVDNVGVLSE